MSNPRAIRDFIYLDLQRLQSFASQLLEGLPESQTRAHGREADFEGEVRAGLPMLFAASTTAKGVLSAGSTLTSTIHHRLVELVLEKLEEQGFLWRANEVAGAPDGAFTLLAGEVQITDPTALRVVFEDFRTLERQMAALTAGSSSPEAAPTRADRRAGRVQTKSSVSQPYLDALVGILRKFGENNVRVRLLDGGETVAVGVAERDKFVEDLGRLTARHGYVMTGRWEILAQVNERLDEEPVIPETGDQTLLDIVESSGFETLKAFADISGAGGAGDDIRITPLAIYRKIEAK